MEQDFKTIHEAGILQDILNMISNADAGIFSKMADKILGRNPDQINISRNIAKSASSLTATFPVIVTEATSLDSAVMISKSIERKAVEMLRMLFAANQITNVTGAQQYLNKFHNNLDNAIDWSGMNVDDVIEQMNKVHESTSPEIEALTAQAIKEVCEDTKKNIHHVLETGLNSVSIQQFNIRGGIKEAQIWRSYKDDDVLNELTVNSSTKTTHQTQYDGPRNGVFTTSRDSDTVEITDPNDIGQIKHAYEVLDKGVLRTDIAKANEAVPSMVVINFVTTGLGGDNVVSTAVIGVKAVLHYVSSEEMINRIVLKNSDNRTLFNFIRATTREISFFKDFLFAVKRAKIDAVARSGKGSNSKIWKILELRADRSKMNRAAGNNNTNCAAITTIVISKAEVDLIKKVHRIDLTKPGTLVSIMRGYNFMCAVIVDEVSERADFLYDDGTGKFETLSFMSLEREMANGEYKKMINAMVKSNGR